MRLLCFPPRPSFAAAVPRRADLDGTAVGRAAACRTQSARKKRRAMVAASAPAAGVDAAPESGAAVAAAGRDGGTVVHFSVPATGEEAACFGLVEGVGGGEGARVAS